MKKLISLLVCQLMFLFNANAQGSTVHAITNSTNCYIKVRPVCYNWQTCTTISVGTQFTVAPHTSGLVGSNAYCCGDPISLYCAVYFEIEWAPGFGAEYCASGVTGTSYIMGTWPAPGACTPFGYGAPMPPCPSCEPTGFHGQTSLYDPGDGGPQTIEITYVP